MRRKLLFKIVFSLVRPVSRKNAKVLIGQRLHVVCGERIIDRRSTISSPRFVWSYITWTWGLQCWSLVTFDLSCMLVSMIKFFILPFYVDMRYQYHLFVTNVVDEVSAFCFRFSNPFQFLGNPFPVQFHDPNNGPNDGSFAWVPTRLGQTM